MIRKLARAVLPKAVHAALAEAAAPARAWLRDRALRKGARQRPLRVVIGASGVFEKGWLPTDLGQLDLLRQETWDRYFAPDSVDALLAEHVWEHLTFDEGKRAAQTCHRYLKPGGYLRIAVPDGLHPDPAYRQLIKVDGVGGGGVGGHKVVYTYKLLQDLLASVGFRTELLEYYDEEGTLHLRNWEPAQGKIHRSSRFDSRGAVSIILDAWK
jgi:predicted SAM-dependent methyltransferase